MYDVRVQILEVWKHFKNLNSYIVHPQSKNPPKSRFRQHSKVRKRMQGAKILFRYGATKIQGCGRIVLPLRPLTETFLF